MKKFKTLIAAVLCIVCVFALAVPAVAADFTDSANDPTTNWSTGVKKRTVYSRPMYDELDSISYSDIGVAPFQELTDIYSINDRIYLLEGGTGRLLILNGDFKLIREISSVKVNGADYSFVGARGVLADKSGRIFIADYSSSRVLIMDEFGTVSTVLTKPESEIWPENLLYQPIKMAVDEMGYIYVLCDGSYYGAVMYNPELEFQGFFGANAVKTSVLTILSNLYDLIFNNNQKRAYTARSLPYSFVDLEVGADGYIYTSTGTTAGTTATGAVRRLNPRGANIMNDKTSTISASASDNVAFATEDVSTLGYDVVSHDISAISIDGNNFIYALDSSYGRVYVYDIECNLLTTIGGGVYAGKQVGTFEKSRAIATYKDFVYVIDSSKNTVAVFKINNYGKLVQQAQTLAINGDYADAAPLWEQVLKLDRNSMLAYRGLGKNYLLKGDYENAMKYSRLGYDRATYSQAYEYVRKDFLTRNFTLIAAIVVVVVVLLVIGLRYKKAHNIVLIKNRHVSLALSTLTHPSDVFYDIKHKGEGSVIVATAILAIWYVFKIIGLTTGFIYNRSGLDTANAWYALGQTFGLVLLFTLGNWAVCVLFEGKGKLREIYITVCYALIPMVINAIGYDILSNVLTLSESSFITILNYVCIALTAIYLIMGLIAMHEYSFIKLVLTTAATVIAMLIVIFLAFMIGILLEQLFDFARTIFMEVMYR